MSIKARAAVVESAGAPFRVQEIELGDPLPGQVLVRVAGTGMCQTDLHVRSGSLYPVPFPAVLGHEGAGVVERVGEGVTSHRPGDAVVVTFAWCGSCRQCAETAINYCDHSIGLNYTEPARYSKPNDANGWRASTAFFGQSSFADHLICDARSAIRVEVESPADLELLGPLACSVQTGAATVLNAARVGPADTVVVFGVGAVGLSAIMAAQASGARRVVAVDLNAERLQLAEELGADAAVDSASADVNKQLRAVVPGGFDVAIDCTGNAAVMTPALRALRATGRFFLVGVPAPGSKVELDPGRLFGKVVSGVVQGDSYPPSTIPELVSLWKRGRLPFDRLVRRFTLDQIDEAARQMAIGQVVKPVIIP